MSHPPEYFENIRRQASFRWDQLEQDPELAGPWHQLFKQVQSPRHVLSELLQNADDAQATEASAFIENGAFHFQHNGIDFTHDHFASLCRFGFSNKRALHTIGFRGIGFKSVFSLGPSVEVRTPTLAVRFNDRRFTEPVWITDGEFSEAKTQIKVAILDQHRLREIKENLVQWSKNPYSLLFFRNIRSLTIDNHSVAWLEQGVGPVRGSQWMQLEGSSDDPMLLVRSDLEPFPEDALAEIQQEKMLGVDEVMEFPPCRVEILLGAEGRLHVVLPTGQETTLSYASNAPFIQDPARLKIKDPEISPTNRWLLNRVGKLAADTMLTWLSASALTLELRAAAYRLFPGKSKLKSLFESSCEETVSEAFIQEIYNKPVLLTEQGDVLPKGECVEYSMALLEVWNPDEVAEWFDSQKRPALSRKIESSDCSRLKAWNMVQSISINEVLEVMGRKGLPRPDTWQQLLKLWSLLSSQLLPKYGNSEWLEKVHIFPAKGKHLLQSGGLVVRFSEKSKLAPCDHPFLAGKVNVLDDEWTEFLQVTGEKRVTNETKEELEAIADCLRILAKFSLDKATLPGGLIQHVAEELLRRKVFDLTGWIHLAHISARLGAKVGDWFRFAAQDGSLKKPGDGLLFDGTGQIAEFLPEESRDGLLLCQDYAVQSESCTKEEWINWVVSDKSGLAAFVGPTQQMIGFSKKHKQLGDELIRRGYRESIPSRYKSPTYQLLDWDFDETLWNHWFLLSQGNPNFWASWGCLILSEHASIWNEKASAKLQVSSVNGQSRIILTKGIIPSWILRMRELPCLLDTKGFSRKPAELLRRTPETEFLIETEPFLKSEHDNETSRPLLDLLGVRCDPTGPDLILDCLRSLATSGNPPVSEVEKWYRLLDRLVEKGSTEDLLTVQAAFQADRLILSQEETWETSQSIFLQSSEIDVPGVALVRPSVAGLSLWNKTGVASRPTPELLIAWLKTLVPDEKVSYKDKSRLKVILSTHPARFIEECGHWLSLDQVWMGTSTFEFAALPGTGDILQHLDPGIKRKAIDLQFLHKDVARKHPFDHWPSISSLIEERLVGSSSIGFPGEKKEWLEVLGIGLSRIMLDSDSETTRIRGLADLLARTECRETPEISLVPLLRGVPAGRPRSAEAVWIGTDLWLKPTPRAKLAKLVPLTISRVFNNPEIQSALDWAFERPLRDIEEYLEENFQLAPVVKKSSASEEGTCAFGDTMKSRSEPINNDQGHPNVRLDTEDPPLEPSPDRLAEMAGDIKCESTIPPRSSSEPSQPVIPAPPKPSVMEIYAKIQGFRMEAQDRFLHSDGSSISKVHGDPFPWHYRSPTGELLHCFWHTDRYLEKQALEIPAEVWRLIEGHPEKYSFVLNSPSGVPEVLSGRTLSKRVESERILIFPASYRLVQAEHQ